MATELGQLVYTLTLNNDGFAEQLDTAKGQVKESSDQISSSNKEVEESSGKAGGAFSGMAGQFVVGAALFTIGQKALETVKGAIDDAVQSAKDWQTQQAGLRAEIKSTGDASGLSAEQVTGLAEGIQKTTPISRDAALAGDNMLLTFTNLHKDVFPATSQAVADMATRMNGGLVPSAQQMSQTALQLGKALNDPATGMMMLRREGVTFSAEQQKTIKSMEAAGNAAGAQKLMLAELNKEFGGSAAANMNTYQGQVDALKNKFNDLVGNGIQKLIKGLEEAGVWLVSHKAALAAVAGIVGALAILIGVVLVNAIWAAVEAMAAGLSPWLLIIIPLGAAVGAIAYEINAHWSTLKKWFQEFVSDIKQWFDDATSHVKGAFTDVTGAITAAWQAIKDAAKDALDWISDRIQDVTGFLDKHKKGLTDIAIVIGTILLPAFVKMAAQAAVSAATTVASWVTSFATASASATASAATTTAAWVVSAAQSAAAWIINLPKVIAEFAVTSAQATVNAVKVAATWVASAVRTAAAWAVTFAEFAAQMAVMVAQFLIQAARMALGWLLALGPIGLIVAAVAGAVALIIANWQTVKDFVVKAWDDIKQWAADAVNFIKDHWALIVDIILGPLGIVVTNVIQHWQTIKNAFLDAVNFVEGVWGTITGFFSRIISTITNAITGGVKGFGTLLFDAGKDIITGLINGIGNMAGAVEDKIKNVANGIKDVAKKILGIFSPSKVFDEEIGQQITAGLAQGINKGANQAVSATANVTNAVIGAASNIPVSAPGNVSNSQSSQQTTYNFQPGSVVLSSKEAVDEMFAISNRNTQLELMGGSPLAGTMGV